MYFKYDNVVKTVLVIVNFIRSSAKINCQIMNFVKELDDDIILCDVNYYCIAMWLSTSNFLMWFVKLFKPMFISHFIFSSLYTYKHVIHVHFLNKTG